MCVCVEERVCVWLCCGFVRMNTCFSKSVDNNSNVTLVLWLNRTAFYVCVSVCINTQNDNRNEQKSKHWFYCKFWFDGGMNLFEAIEEWHSGSFEGISKFYYRLESSFHMHRRNTAPWIDLYKRDIQMSFVLQLSCYFFPFLCSSRVIKVKIKRYLP